MLKWFILGFLLTFLPGFIVLILSLIMGCEIKEKKNTNYGIPILLAIMFAFKDSGSATNRGDH